LAGHYQSPIEHFLPDDEQLHQAANFGQAVWDKATPQERAVLKDNEKDLPSCPSRL